MDRIFNNVNTRFLVLTVYSAEIFGNVAAIMETATILDCIAGNNCDVNDNGSRK
jgi:hypothetical protein